LTVAQIFNSNIIAMAMDSSHNSQTPPGAHDEASSHLTSSFTSLEKIEGGDDRSDDNRSRLDIIVSPEPSAKAISPPVGAPPDGGLKAWSVVAGGFFALFVSFGWINCIFQRNMKRMTRMTLTVGTRHRSLPDVLRNPSIEQLFS
jgi:hypothetical protein